MVLDASKSLLKQEKVEMKSFMTMVVAAASMVAVAGCNPDQNTIRELAKATGTGVTIVWISYDNPTAAQKAALVDVLAKVKTAVVAVGTNGYVAVAYPVMQAYVEGNANIPAIDKPLVMAGALAVLSGIDIMFATHPDWKTGTDEAGKLAVAFIDGANVALALPASDPQVMKANEMNKARMGIKR